MSESLSNANELKFLWKRRGNKDYELKNFIFDGTFIQYMVFDDRRKGQKNLGKIVSYPREGEAYHWPRLQHENLVPLLDIISLNETKSVYIFPYIGNSLKNIIHDKGFLGDPESFDRKKKYTEDILWALDFLHQKSLCLMNLTEHIIYVSDDYEKAVLCDFSCVLLIERATKENIRLPLLYQAPEINAHFQPIAAETWACGVLFLQIFTTHSLPSAFVGNEVYQVLRAVQEINYNIIKEANPSCQLHSSDIENLKMFLNLFLDENPYERIEVQIAATSAFLRRPEKRTPKSDLCNKLIEFGENIVHPIENTWDKVKLENYKADAFKDIYLNEAAKYRDKLKQVQCTNKFINLDFVPDCYISKDTDEVQYHIKKKTSPIKKSFIGADEPIEAIQLSYDTLEKSKVKESKGIISGLLKNQDPSMEFSEEINISKLKGVEDVSGDVVEDHYLNYQHGNNFLDVFDNNYEDGLCLRDMLEDYKKEMSESKCNSPIERSISTDSLESSEITSVIPQNTLYTSCRPDLNLVNRKQLPSSDLQQKNIRKFSYINKTRQNTFNAETDSKSDFYVKNFKSKDSIIFSQSDPNLHCLNYPKIDSNSLNSMLCSPHLNDSKKNIILDSETLNKKSDNSKGYKWSSHGIKIIDSPLNTKLCTKTVDNIKAYDLVKSEDVNEGEITRETNDYCQTQKKIIKPYFNRRYSYEKAISQCANDNSISGTCKNKVSKWKKIKSPIKNIFNKDRSNISGNKKTNNVLSKQKREYDVLHEDKPTTKENSNDLPEQRELDISNEIDQRVKDNPSTTIFSHLSSPKSMETFLLGNKPNSMKKHKNQTKRKRKWIQIFCPGSKTN